ncbi:MAG TPA: Ig-like domain-containing protein, partial [Rudaea sp.]|nr:Ig-like domain-containing protein [Rudaea sp.]
SNAGLALTQGGVVKASTSNASPSTVTLSLVDGTKYRLTLTYDTGVSASGDIGVRAFSAPQNLITANLLSSVTFSAISLSSSAINPVAAAVGSSRGTPQGATVGTAFAAPFQVTVLDDAGDPVPNVTVTFSAPTSGPSATLAATTATTDANGQAHVTGVANSIAGNYTITATVDGVATPAVFELNNIAGSAATVGSAGGTPQDATVTKAFATSLGVTVLDASNNPVSGITVIFTAPDSGASASFPNGATANTDGSGHAQVDAVANTVAGNYVVTASVHGAGTTASFALTNVAGPAAQATPSSGTPQSATVSTAFDDPLGVAITDAYGNPISGATVTFSVHPNAATGAGAVFPPDQTTIDVITDSSGLALVGAIANEYPGSYQIVATGDGLPTAVAFNLTNAAAVTPHGDPTSGGQQSANANAAFSCLLQLKVTSDGTTPMPGVSIDFVAPTSGPSATLSDGTNNGTTVTEFTDVNGLVAVTAQANAIPGQYAISAGVTGSGTSLASYTLTNFPAGERIFGTGFEQLPAVCP